MNGERPGERDDHVVELVSTGERSADSPSRRRLGIAALVIVSVVLASYASDRRPDDGTADAVRTSTAPEPTVERPAPPARPTPRAVAAGGMRADTDAPAAAPLAAAPEVGPAVTTTLASPPPPPPPPPQPLLPPPAVVARPVPSPGPATPAPAGPAPWWTSRRTAAGYLGTDVGCASGASATALDAFFRSRMGPVIGHDYQHVYALGEDRWLWLFQDTFLDHGGNAERLDQTSFAHNTAMLQHGACFTLLHRGTAEAPASFEPGTGERTLGTWFWPLGGETLDGQLRVFWAEMAKTADPQPPDGLGWVPVRTWLATYDTATLARVGFVPAPDPGVSPIYGFAVSSDAEHTYLFGNTFDQNLARQGGYHGCPCSATAMSLARVPHGHLHAAPEYWTATGWSADPGAAVPFLTRYHAENPMQPRYLGGQWVAVTKVDGYWADELAIDVAEQPWGPWTTVSRGGLAPRGGDPLMNTYHAHLMPWLSGGSLVVGVSQNARDMLRDAWPHPERYRLQFLGAALVPPPAALVPPPAAPPPSTSPTTTPTTIATSTVPPTSPTTSDPPAPTSTDPAETTPTSTDPPTCDPTSSTSSTTSSSTTSTTTPCRQP